MLLERLLASAALPLTLGISASSVQGQGPLFNPSRGNASGPMWRIATGDVNSDGRTDAAAVLDTAPTKLDVWFGGPGGYPIVPATTDVSPPFNPDCQSLVITDCDADGDADVFTLSLTGNPPGVQLLEGNGTGALTPTGFFPLGHGGLDITAADVNGDGRADLAIAGTKELFFMASTGGGFAPTQVFTMTTLQAVNGQRVGYGDLDNDGDLDIVCCNTSGASGSAFAFRNAGAGSYAPNGSTALASPIQDLAVGDLDNDGFADAALTLGGASASLTWLRGGPGGSLAAPQAIVPLPGGFAPMAIADVNHDSALDVACVGDFGVIRALTHAGGAFSEAAKSPGGFGGNSMRIADANGDGHADFLLGVHASLGPSRLTVLCGDGAGGMLGLASSPPSNPIGSLEMIDWTGDGLPDLLTTAPASLDVYVGSGSSFTPTASAPMPQGTHVPAVADFNLDGLADAVSPGANGSMGSLYLTLGNGAGGFGAVKVFPVEQGYIPYRTAAGDFNADGAPDAVSFDNYTSKVSFLPGDGNGNLAAPIPLAAPAAPWDIAAADVNVDGNLDVVASTGGSIKSFLGGPGGPVAGPMTVDTSGSFPTIGLGDSTGDGVPDVVTSGSSQSTFYVGTGSGAFVKRATFGLTTNERPRLLSVNLDERVDLVIPDADGTLIVYFGTATGFSPSAGASYLPMSFTGHTILGDFDVDGVLDAVRGSETTGEILLARGLASPPAGTGAFGSGTAGCDGGQGIRGNAPPAVGLSSFGVSCTNAPSSALGLLLYADATHAGGLDVFGIGVALHVDPFAATEFGALNLTSDAGGVAFVPVPIPNNPALHGKSFGLQGVWLWAPGRRCTPTPFGLSSTQGLSITLP